MESPPTTTTPARRVTIGHAFVRFFAFSPASRGAPEFEGRLRDTHRARGERGRERHAGEELLESELAPVRAMVRRYRRRRGMTRARGVRKRRCRCSRSIRPHRRRRHQHQHHRVLVSSANHRYLATMDALDLSTRAISAANHRHRRRRSNERTIESRCGHAPPPVRVRGVRGRRRVMTLPGVPETPERWEGLRTPRGEGSGAPRARARDASRRDETGDGGAGRSRATATATAADAGRRRRAGEVR